MAAGIFFTDTFRIEAGIWPIVGMSLLLLGLGLSLRSSVQSKRWWFGVGVSVFMFLVGVALTEHAWKRVKVEWNQEKQAYQGVVMETPQEKPKSYQCRLDVSGKEVLVFLPKDSLSASIRTGDELLFYTRLEAPRNKDSFQEFDYARYLFHDGISGTAFVPSGAWRKSEGESNIGLKQRALLFRERILDKFRQWGVGEEALPVLSALTLGYKGDLDKETMQTYSVAGISHVLALSGMHIAIVWCLLDVLLKPLAKKRWKGLKWLLTTCTLWAFAFVVGLEASVVRAVVMCMLMELGRMSGTRPLSMNTLGVAAFFMLFYQPFYLFDVGFQLSFVAVASILSMYSLVNGWLPMKNRVTRWVGGTIAVSVTAQLGTAPLVMYYFSDFSVYFLIANFVAAILVPLIIYGTVLMVLAPPCTWIQGYVVKVLNGCVEGLNMVADWTSRLPYATFSVSVLNPLEVALFYVGLALGVIYLKTRKRAFLIGTMIAVVCLLGVHLFILWTRW